MNLLLIEDNKADVILFNSLFKEEDPFHRDLRVGVVHTIKEAIQALKEKKFDVILLDLNLPDATGIHGLNDILPYASDIPIVVYSGSYDDDLAREAMHMGAQDVILKGTLSKTQLIRTLVNAKIRQELLSAARNKAYARQ